MNAEHVDTLEQQQQFGRDMKLKAERIKRMLDEGLSRSVITVRMGMPSGYTKKKLQQLVERWLNWTGKSTPA